jgi:Cu(I)/Ag(I) efflux system protein CusF
MKTFTKLLIAVTLTASSGVFAAGAEDPRTATTPHAAMSDGEIKKIDKEGQKITIKHGELQNLGMPGMTMVFRVQTSAMLDQVKVGDKIKFVAEKVGGSLTVTSLEVQK